MSKIFAFLGAFIFIVYFYGFVGLLSKKKAGENKNYGIYTIMAVVNIAAWIITRNLIIKYL